MITIPYTFNIKVVFYVDISQYDIAASTYKDINIVDGNLPSGIDVELSDQEQLDYDTFIENVEDLLTDYYGFLIYYENESKYNSYYYGMVATDEKGDPIFRFNLDLRISTHLPHRSKQSQKHKKDSKSTMLKFTNGKKLKPIYRAILINDTQFESYTEAIVHISDVIDEVIAIMSR